LQLALYVRHKEIALFVLGNFPLTVLNETYAAQLFDLQELYGAQWCLSLLEQAKNKVTSRYRENHLIKNFSSLVHSLTAVDIDSAAIDFLITYQFDALIQHNDQWKHARPVELKESFHAREDILDDIFKALAELNQARFIDHLIQYVISNVRLYPNIELAPFFIKWQDNANFQKTVGYMKS
jgi:hypothetical protein